MNAAFNNSNDSVKLDDVQLLPDLAKTKSKLDIEKQTFEKAYCKLVTVSIVSVFFIIC